MIKKELFGYQINFQNTFLAYFKKTPTKINTNNKNELLFFFK